MSGPQTPPGASRNGDPSPKCGGLSPGPVRKTQHKGQHFGDRKPRGIILPYQTRTSHISGPQTPPGAGRNGLGIAIDFYPALVSSPNKYFRPKSTILRYRTSPRHIFFRKQRGGRNETATPLQNAKGDKMEGFYGARCRVWGYKGSSGQRKHAISRSATALVINTSRKCNTD